MSGLPAHLQPKKNLFTKLLLSANSVQIKEIFWIQTPHELTTPITVVLTKHRISELLSIANRMIPPWSIQGGSVLHLKSITQRCLETLVGQTKRCKQIWWPLKTIRVETLKFSFQRLHTCWIHNHLEEENQSTETPSDKDWRVGWKQKTTRGKWKLKQY